MHTHKHTHIDTSPNNHPTLCVVLLCACVYCDYNNSAHLISSTRRVQLRVVSVSRLAPMRASRGRTKCVCVCLFLDRFDDDYVARVLSHCRTGETHIESGHVSIFASCSQALGVHRFVSGNRPCLLRSCCGDYELDAFDFRVRPPRNLGLFVSHSQ